MKVSTIAYRAAMSLLFTLTMVVGLSTISRARIDQGALLVLNKSENTLAIVDPSILKVVARVSTGEAPHEVTVSADGRLAFVSNYGTGERPGNSLSVIDIAARKDLKRVDLGALIRPHGITEANGKIYFTVEGSRAVARYDPVANSVDWIMGTGQAGTHMVVASRTSGKLFTANIGSNTVSAIEVGSSKVTQILVGNGPEGIAISPDDREVWVAHRQDGTLSIIDTATDKVKETFRVRQSPIRVKFTPDGKRVLVSDPQSGDVIVIDAATRKEVKRIQVGGGPVGMVITLDGHRAFVARSQANKVSMINVDDLTVAGEFEPGLQPDGLAFVK
jgi:YVTN family beta-propeller protein